MATYTSYEEVGAKEDISDVISNITPTKTPFQSGIGSEKITNKVFGWQEDSLRAVSTNAKAEGADAVDATINPTVMRTNYAQILSETVKVADTVEAISYHGRAKEMAYQLRKSSDQVKRDFENALVGTAQTAAAGDNTTPTARTFAGYQVQLDSSAVVYTGATTNPLDEPHLLTCLQDLFSNGSDPSRIQVTPSNSLVVAGFAAAAGRYRTFQNGTAGDKTITNVVNLYVSPFGEQKVEINRFLRTKNTLVFDPSMWSKATLRPWTRVTLAKTGDATRMMIVGEFSLKHKNQKASGAVVEAVSGF